jgi:hypothetical protein
MNRKGFFKTLAVAGATVAVGSMVDIMPKEQTITTEYHDLSNTNIGELMKKAIRVDENGMAYINLITK